MKYHCCPLGLWRCLTVFCLLALSSMGYAATPPLHKELATNPTDSLYDTWLQEVTVVAQEPPLRHSQKLFAVPGSFSLLPAGALQAHQLQTTGDLSALVPGLYIPEYGSRLTSAIYYRGIGTRGDGQTVGIYVDGVPTLTKTLNRHLHNVSSIEVMSAAHSSTYGRNSMAGSIHVKTVDALEHAINEQTLSVGNYTNIHYKGIMRWAVDKHWGISLGGFLSNHEGYFQNLFTQKKADPERTGAGLLKVEWRPNTQHKLMLAVDADHVRQGAFPYRLRDKKTGHLAPINYNAPSQYKRSALQNRLRYTYQNQHLLLNVAAGLEFLKDSMQMDQDYLPIDLFRLTQKQNQWATTAEVILQNKPSEESHYAWTVGTSFFYQANRMEVPVEVCPAGLNAQIQSGLDRLNESGQLPITLTVDQSQSAFNLNTFRKGSLGGAIFHESTLRNLLVKGLAFTAGIRIDMEQPFFDYNSLFNISVQASPRDPARPARTIAAGEHLVGAVNQRTIEWLPKIAISYAPTEKHLVFLSLAKGYKSGGYNEQMMTELTLSGAQKSLMAQLQGKEYPKQQEGDHSRATYKPEYAINWEAGYRTSLCQNKLYLSATLFWSNITNLQLTKFAPGGTGRQVVNAGKSTSYGAELQAAWRIIPGLQTSLSYGYTQALFTDMKNTDKKGEEIDLSGNHVPYIPQHTLSAMVHYKHTLNRGCLRYLYAVADVKAVGPTWRTESNELKEPFYATLGGKIGVRIGEVECSLWGRNLTNTRYHLFYFSSMGNDFLQQAPPLTFGAEVSWKF